MSSENLSIFTYCMRKLDVPFVSPIHSILRFLQCARLSGSVCAYFSQVSYFHFIMLCMLNNNTSTSCSVSITQSFAFVVGAFHFVGCCDFYTPTALTEIGVILFHLIKMFSAQPKFRFPCEAKPPAPPPMPLKHLGPRP